jgi:hypothetical protein
MEASHNVGDAGVVLVSVDVAVIASGRRIQDTSNASHEG